MHVCKIETLEEAYKLSKKNSGVPGIDGVIFEQIEEQGRIGFLTQLKEELENETYQTLRNRRQEIPKAINKVLILGILTVADRVAQMVAKIYFEPAVEPHFHPDSYGYRPGKSAHDALTITRKRCWEYDWVLEFDIKGLFDNIDHELLMKAVRKYTDNPWIILYIQRWLKSPFQNPDGTVVERSKGAPQGGVISPVLANLFMHYAFDMWMVREQPDKPFARYADDGIANCSSLKDTQALQETLKMRFKECGLELHPEKTRIIYCKDDNRKGDYPETSFDFLGYTFRPRKSKSWKGKYFINFTSAVSNKAKKTMQQTIRGWRMHLKPDKEIEDLSRMFNPVIRGWINYYGRFYKSELFPVLRHMDKALTL